MSRMAAINVFSNSQNPQTYRNTVQIVQIVLQLVNLDKLRLAACMASLQLSLEIMFAFEVS